jgi:YD repeat-containing protein
VHSFTYEEIVDPDDPQKSYVRITRDDGRYVIVLQAGDVRAGIPRITEHYSADGVLRARVEESRDRQSGEVSISRTIYFYDEDGELVETRERSGTITYEFADSGVRVTRTFDNGRSVVVDITERDAGYEITRDGTTYLVELRADEVLIMDADGEEIATVILGEDGSWEVVYADRESETGEL